MLTPRGYADVFPQLYRDEIAAGDMTKILRMTVLDARSLCYGIVWLAEGTYNWITEAERTAIHAMAARLRTVARPAGLAETPEEQARRWLKRFKAMSVDAKAGLTLGDALTLCEALEQLATATYPYPLTEQAQQVQARAAAEHA